MIFLIITLFFELYFIFCIFIKQHNNVIVVKRRVNKVLINLKKNVYDNFEVQKYSHKV